MKEIEKEGKNGLGINSVMDKGNSYQETADD